MSTWSPAAPPPARCSSRSALWRPTWRWRSSILVRATSVGSALLLCAIAAAIGAPVLAPNDPDRQFRGLLDAPPTIPHVVDDSGAWHAPFIYPWILVNRLEQRFQQDRSARVPLAWLSRGALVRSTD